MKREQLFAELCAQLCEQAGLEMPAMELDSDGRLAMTLQLGKLAASLFYVPELDIGNFFVMLDLCDEPEPGDLDAWRTYMDTNFRLLGQPGAPTLCRSPEAGRMVLRYEHALGRTTVDELGATLAGAIGLARECLEGAAT